MLPRSPRLGGGTINSPRSASLHGNDSACLDTSQLFYLNFCNIRGLSSNFQSVEHHLLSAKPHLLFLTETQVSEHTDSIPYSVSLIFSLSSISIVMDASVYCSS